MFSTKLKERQDAGIQPCACWDCLRAVGLTPPGTPDKETRDHFTDILGHMFTNDIGRDIGVQAS